MKALNVSRNNGLLEYRFRQAARTDNKYSIEALEKFFALNSLYHGEELLNRLKRECTVAEMEEFFFILLDFAFFDENKNQITRKQQP